jgi:cytochrome P450
MAREALCDDEVAGFPIPARSTVMIPPYLTHRHPAFWPEAEKFDPERFSPGKTLPHRFAYFPFGGGPRLCLGQNFALYEGQMLLAMVAGRFRLELAPGEKLAMHPSLALRPHHGLFMTRRRR